MAVAGQHEEGARLLGPATAIRASLGAPLPGGERRDVDRIEAVLRRSLGDDAFVAEFGRGMESPHSYSELARP